MEREREGRQSETGRGSRPVGDDRMGRERGWRVGERAAGGSILPFVLLSLSSSPPTLRNVYRDATLLFLFPCRLIST